MKLKREELEKLQHDLKVAFLKVSERIDKEYEAVKTPSKRMSKFFKEKDELIQKNSKKDKNGKPILKTRGAQSYAVLKDEEQHKKEFDVLFKRYKNEFAKQAKKEADFAKTLKDEIEIELEILNTKL